MISAICFGQPTSLDSISLYVIRPKHRISWKSPSSLLIKTAINSIRDDYAPIGHFAIELNCSSNNMFSINHVITGMERLDLKQSKKIVLKEKLGLGSLFYSFKGNLVSSIQTKKEIEQARKDKRLKKMTVSISPDNCTRAMEFIETWINNGSYIVYGGGKNTLQGEGAGCADFASTLFKLSTNYNLPDEWIVRRKIPKNLINDGQKKISFLKLLFSHNWASEDEEYLIYETVEANKSFDWLERRSGDREDYLYSINLMASELKTFESSPVDFLFNYNQDNNPEHIWGLIKY